ncbi:MAG: hypothetical protein L0Y80_06580 [Ignavibacteriae bacterium]|nr:hypothetical protein [Ignavibacteriota bacterium]
MVSDLSWNNIRRWIVAGGFAIVEQALFAGTNFIVNILLARLLSQEDYGAFAIAFSIYLLVGYFHLALLTEPMLVFGAGKYAKKNNTYLALLIYCHVVLTVVLGVLLATGAFAATGLIDVSLQQALFGLGLSIPMIMLLWLVRKVFYVRFQPSSAALGGFLYMALLLIATFLIQKAGLLNTFTAYLIMGGSALIVSLIFLATLKPQWTTVAHPMFFEVVGDHWRYGRWALGTAVLVWIPTNIYYLVLPTLGGLEASGALRAIMNLLLPVLHVYSTISFLLIPQFVKLIEKGGKQSLTRRVQSVLIVFVGGGVLFWIFLGLFNTEILDVLYKGQYLSYAGTITMIGFLAVLAAIAAVMGAGLRAMQQAKYVFLSYTVSTIITLTVGMWLCFAYGIQGAIAALIVSSLTTTIMMTIFYFKRMGIAVVDTTSGEFLAQ